jgi:FKBP-type peptidyl-prolyl cis-trans isomerase FklB
MKKSLAVPMIAFMAGTMLLGEVYAQQTSPSSTEQSTTSKSQKAPAARSPQSSAKGQGTLILKTDKDKASYAIGMNIGAGLHRDSVDIDPKILLRGLEDALAGNKPLLTDDEMRAALVALQTQVRKEQEEKMEAASAANKKAGDDFLAANKTKDGVTTLPSGLQYKILKQGTGPKPTATDSVVCNYRGTLIDGTEFDSSYKRGQPATFPVNRVIKGWTEALQLMPVGSTWQLFVPADLAYGPHPPSPAIGPNSTLVFEVELLSIKPKGQ